jgi:hypothetical protein
MVSTVICSLWIVITSDRACSGRPGNESRAAWWPKRGRLAVAETSQDFFNILDKAHAEHFIGFVQDHGAHLAEDQDLAVHQVD